MRKLFLAVGALLAVLLAQAAPATAGGWRVARVDEAKMGHVHKVHGRHHHRHAHRHHRHHRHYHRHHHHHHHYHHGYRHGYRAAYPYYGVRVYEVPRYAYRPYYYTAWSYPHQGVYAYPRYARWHSRW